MVYIKWDYPYIYTMKKKQSYPEFITPLMKIWLKQNKPDNLNNITVLGLFDWRFKSNKRNPQKKLRRVNITNSVRLKDSSFKMEYYFLELNDSKLHVYKVSGFSKAGYAVANEYVFRDNCFTKGVILISKIS